MTVVLKGCQWQCTWTRSLGKAQAVHFSSLAEGPCKLFFILVLQTLKLGLNAASQDSCSVGAEHIFMVNSLSPEMILDENSAMLSDQMNSTINQGHTTTEVTHLLICFSVPFCFCCAWLSYWVLFYFIALISLYQLWKACFLLHFYENFVYACAVLGVGSSSRYIQVMLPCNFSSQEAFWKFEYIRTKSTNKHCKTNKQTLHAWQCWSVSNFVAFEFISVG